MSMTWAQFNAAVRVYLHQYNSVTTVQDLIDALIIKGVADVQRAVKFYQTGHVETLAPGDMTQQGFAFLGTLPAGKITQARFVKYDTDEAELRPNVFRTLHQVGWDKFPAMRGGELGYCDGVIALDPINRRYAVSPSLNSKTRLVFEWEGIKTDFNDADPTPFDDRLAEVVSDYVLSKIARTVDKDRQQVTSYEGSYLRGKRYLVSDANWNAVVESDVQSQLDGDETYSGGTFPPTSLGALFVYRNDITSLLGVSDSLEAVPTYEVLGTDTIYVLVISGIFQHWRLVAGTDATDVNAGFVRPDDYDGTSNARVWQKIG